MGDETPVVPNRSCFPSPYFHSLVFLVLCPRSPLILFVPNILWTTVVSDWYSRVTDMIESVWSVVGVKCPSVCFRVLSLDGFQWVVIFRLWPKLESLWPRSLTLGVGKTLMTVYTHSLSQEEFLVIFRYSGLPTSLVCVDVGDQCKCNWPTKDPKGRRRKSCHRIH